MRLIALTMHELLMADALFKKLSVKMHTVKCFCHLRLSLSMTKMLLQQTTNIVQVFFTI